MNVLPEIIQIGELPQCFTPHRFGAKIGTFFEGKLPISVRFKGTKIGCVRRPASRETPRKLSIWLHFFWGRKGGQKYVFYKENGVKTHQSFEPLRVLLGAPSLLCAFTAPRVPCIFKYFYYGASYDTPRIRKNAIIIYAFETKK